MATNKQILSSPRILNGGSVKNEQQHEPLPHTLEELLLTLSPENNLNGLSANDKTLIWNAYQQADELYRQNQPESATLQLIHLLETAKILIAYKLDAEAIAAAFLHKLYEAEKTTLPAIEDGFGPTVASLTDRVSRLTEIDRLHENKLAKQSRVESFRRMFLAMIDDVRVVLIKLAERLHTMRTLNSLPEAERLRVARGTMEIMAPLANRLGIWQIKAELEDRAFHFLDPESYKKISQALEVSREEHKGALEQIINQVKEILYDIGFTDKDFEIYGRPKHIYSIYKKLNTPKYHGYGVERIYEKKKKK